MANLVVVDQNGVEHVVEGKPNRTIMEIIRDAGFDDLLALCGGCCSCATCHVHVDPAFGNRTAKMSEDENDLLDTASSRDENSRLSCQIMFTADLDGMRVTLSQDD